MSSPAYEFTRQYSPTVVKDCGSGLVLIYRKTKRITPHYNYHYPISKVAYVRVDRATKLMKLPIEVLLHVLGFLDRQALERVLVASRLFAAIVNRHRKALNLLEVNPK